MNNINGRFLDKKVNCEKGEGERDHSADADPCTERWVSLTIVFLWNGSVDLPPHFFAPNLPNHPPEPFSRYG